MPKPTAHNLPLEPSPASITASAIRHAMKISPLNLLGIIARHRVAPNMLMLVMIIVGLWAIQNLNIRFFPKFELQLIVVSVPWSGAAAEDVEISLIQPLENELRNVSRLDKMTSVSRDNNGIIYLEFPEDVDIDEAANEVKQYVDQAATQLPADAETPRVKKIVHYDDIMQLALSGNSLSELRRIARQIEIELNDLGVAKVDVLGLPREEIQVHVERRRLVELNTTVRDLGTAIAAQNRDASAGDIAVGDGQARLRALSKSEDLFGLADVAVASRPGGGVLRLGDVADITRTAADNQKVREFDENLAVVIHLKRRTGDNLLQSAERIHQWIEKKRAALPPSVLLQAHDEKWEVVKSRLDLLLVNGAQGLVLVVLILFVFLSGRVAFWVAIGIPAVFLGTLFVMKLSGGTINMISMFSLIMATGIIVDDAIVVGENAVYEHEKGRPPLVAAVGGAWAMVAPVVASTFTTISSFLPLFVISGIIGSIIYDIPFVIVCILLAALFECFFILPGHLYSAFDSMQHEKPSAVRQKLEAGFHYFQEHHFRPLAQLAVKYRGATIATCLGILIFSLSLFGGGLVNYRFFPSAEQNIVNGNVAFTSGTPQEKVRDYVGRLTAAAHLAEDELGAAGNLLRHISVEYGAGGSREQPLSGDEYAKVQVELIGAETRRISARDFVRAWKNHAPQSPGLENLSIQELRGGPPGADLEVLLTGENIESLKTAALEVQEAFRAIPGVSQPTDDTPFGKSQIAFELNALGRSLGLSTGDVAAQLRDAVDGYKAQTFYEGVDEIEVRIFQTGAEQAGNLSSFQVRLPGGGFAALEEVAILRPRRGFDTINRIGGRTAIKVVGEVDFAAIGDLQAVIAGLRENELPEIAARYGVNFSFEGQQADQRQTIADMKIGLLMALLFIYIILTWVFSSWTVPLVIMLTMPLGIIGAILGHWLINIEMSILSFFGVFALMGIIVNDSIVLVRYFQEQRRANPLSPDASPDAQIAAADSLIVEAACRRLRAVLLTSLTTIGGLLPLMFEKSTQAQFLIPMAVSICFGLMFATLLILLFTPACMSYHQSLLVSVQNWRQNKAAAAEKAVIDSR